MHTVMKKSFLRLLLLAFVLAGVLAVASPSAYAHDGPHNEQSSHRSSDTTAQKHRLEGAKKRTCEARKTTINGIMSRSTARVSKQIQLFGTISERVQKFYAQSGLTIANYDTLVAAIDEAKAKVQTDLRALEATDTFTCDGQDPKGDAEAHRAAMKSAVEDLKAYKKAVKDLIVAVRSAKATEGSA